MKMINAGAADIADYHLYSYNCNVGICKRPYFAPVPTFGDVQLYVKFGTIKPTSVTFTKFDLCGSEEPEEIHTSCYIIANNGSYWYGIFKGFSTATSFEAFLIALEVTYTTGPNGTFFSEQYRIGNTCETLTKLQVCYPANYNAEDINGIYVGEPDGSQTITGNDLIYYQHLYWVRDAEAPEIQNKITFVNNWIKNFSTKLNKIFEFRPEPVPGWYKDYLLSVYFRGQIKINDVETKISDLNFDLLVPEANIWKAYVKIDKELRGTFGCAPIDCSTTDCECVNVGFAILPIILPAAQVGVAYNYTIFLTGTAPFTLSDIVKPAWMTITIVGSTIVFSGTPAVGDITSDDDHDTINVSLNIHNCGDEIGTISQHIDVHAADATPFTVVLVRTSANHLEATIYGGTPPYTFVFGHTFTGACPDDLNFVNPSGPAVDPGGGDPWTCDTDYSLTNWAGSHYYFKCTVTDSTTAVAVSNIVSQPTCLVPETNILMWDGSEMTMAELIPGYILAGENTVLGASHHIVDRLYVINDGLLKASEGHIHILYGGLHKTSAELIEGDLLTDRYGQPVRIETLEMITGSFKVVNISTETKEFIANGILTHNKMICHA